MRIRGKSTTDSINFLKNRWFDLCANLSGDDQTRNSILNLLITLYSESHRAYHNFRHIESLLRWAENFAENIDDFQTFGFAVWFHDAVYDASRHDNEEQSANLAVAKLQSLKISDAQIAIIRQMILATKSHDVADLDADGKLFLDLDLSILGADVAVYQTYSRAIRREYSFVPEPIYQSGRQKILQNFLVREFIYSTAIGREKFELPARENIEREIIELSKLKFDFVL